MRTLSCLAITAVVSLGAIMNASAESMTVTTSEVGAERLGDGPLVDASTHSSIGENIQGPSLIGVPDWIENPLGRYYLYFADHKGQYIRMAYADELLGPWKVHVPGTLHLKESHFATRPPEVTEQQQKSIRARGKALGIKHDILATATTPHIASPDVQVDVKNRRIVMYYHGLESLGTQLTRVATSSDGIQFEAREEVLGRAYMRVFQHDGMTYGMAVPGQFYRSKDGLSGFEEGPSLFNANMRHSALLKRQDTLYVFWTQIGDTPERILLSTIDLSKGWSEWSPSEPVEVLRPELAWEGADAPLEPSTRSVAYGKVNQLRDPAIYVEGDRTYLLYAIAGEGGIAIAELSFLKEN
jgi:hypothetical protein